MLKREGERRLACKPADEASDASRGSHHLQLGFNELTTAPSRELYRIIWGY